MDSPTVQTMKDDDKKAFPLNLLALLCGIWFVLTSWLWADLANLVISYPVGLVGFLLWNLGRKRAPHSRLNRVAFALLLTGLVASVVSFFLYK